MKFISEITTDYSNQGLHITFDLDWANEEILEDTLMLLEKYNAKATLFITNKFSQLKELQKNPKYEIGIHPNFTHLLNNTKAKLNSSDMIIDDLLNIAPEARSVRSHGLVQSSYLTKLFFLKGMTHESNIRIPISTSNVISPFKHASGIIICPFQWGDYSNMSESIVFDQNTSRYLVVNFHPIHVYLNTESLDRYERTRPLHNNPKELLKHRFEGFGTRNKLIELLESQNK